jgi:hypothetical protein
VLQFEVKPAKHSRKFARYAPRSAKVLDVQILCKLRAADAGVRKHGFYARFACFLPRIGIAASRCVLCGTRKFGGYKTAKCRRAVYQPVTLPTDCIN